MVSNRKNYRFNAEQDLESLHRQIQNKQIQPFTVLVVPVDIYFILDSSCWSDYLTKKNFGVRYHRN